MRRPPLVYNTHNAVTVSLSRVERPNGRPGVRKVISGAVPPSHPDWIVSEQRHSWRWWRREAELMAAGMHQVYAPEGLRGPEAWRVGPTDVPDQLEMVMEDVSGRTGRSLSAGDLVDVAGRLGRAQGRLARRPVPWTGFSRSFLRDHIASKHVDPRWLDDESAWRHPLVAAHWPDGLREGLTWLWGVREEVLARLEAGPRTVAHLDLWSRNLIAQPDGWVVLDWACAGEGAMGEDPSNLVYEAVLDGDVPAETMGELSAAVRSAYVVGVMGSGWSGDVAAVDRAVRLSAIKWCWLGLLHLQRAVEGGHHDYGGVDSASPEAQYRARGLALQHAVAEVRSAMAEAPPAS